MIGVDLFCGAGGMTLGAKLAGIHVVFSVEADPHAAATYAANHPEVNLFQRDIRRLREIPLCAWREQTTFRAILQAPEVLSLEAGRLTSLASARTLRVRNWHDGDRFRQSHSAGEKKVKENVEEAQTKLVALSKLSRSCGMCTFALYACANFSLSG